MRKANLKTPLGDGLRHRFAISIICPVIVSALVLLLFFPTNPAVAGSIVGWGSQVVGVNLDGGFINIAADRDHSLALRSDGSIVVWGADYYGQATPPDGNDFVAIAAGSGHSIALKADGSIVAWGRNNYGQCDVPSTNSSFVAGSGYAVFIADDSNSPANLEFRLSADGEMIGLFGSN